MPEGISDFIFGRGALKKAEKTGDSKKSDSGGGSVGISQADIAKMGEEAAAKMRADKAAKEKAATTKKRPPAKGRGGKSLPKKSG